MDNNLPERKSRRASIAGAVLAAAMLLAISGAAVAAPTGLVHTSDLNGKSLSLPADLPAQRTLVLLAFRHEDQTVLEGWRKGLNLADERADWIEVPVVGISNPLIQSMIRGGMRGKHPTAAGRAHVAPLFGDAAAIAKSLGVEPNAVTVLVMDRSGHVLATAIGSYSAEKALALTAALRR